jgi:hypothetical protein
MPRRTILTQAALVRVASLVDHGSSAAEIASEIGCTLGTLRVRCSQHGISLRRRGRGSRESIAATDRAPSREADAAAQLNSADRVNTVEQSSTAASGSAVELKVLLPQITREQLRQRGALTGISSSTLASELIKTVARDCLYDAVLDSG